MRKREAVTPPETVGRLLDAAGLDLVLVGGQALATWMYYYELADLASNLPAISNDVDFLTKSAADTNSVGRLAQVIQGKVILPNKRALTALVGQAVLDVSDAEYINVDVIFKVIGFRSPATIRDRAVKLTSGRRSPFLVMHPLDVLYSRLMNLHTLPEKQDDKGMHQLALAIDVAREFLRRAASDSSEEQMASGRSPIQHYVSQIEKWALGDAGKKVVRRYGLHVADAIDPALIPAGPFWTRRWPRLKQLMSADYAAGITEP